MADSTSPLAERCPRCEAELREDAVLCPLCGYHLNEQRHLAKGGRSRSPTPGSTSSPLVLLRSLFTTDGRISRSHWWTIELVWSFVIVALGFLMKMAPALEVVAVIGIWVGGGMFFIAQIKRWHDRDKPGQWCLINVIPVIGWLWTLIELGFLRGTKGPNGYGDDPTA